MKRTLRIATLVAALMLASSPLASADHGGRGRRGGEHFRGGYGYYQAPGARHYSGPIRHYYRGGPAYVDGRFYNGRGYYYGGRFWARPYFGFGIGIPFGYGYSTPAGCGYHDGWGRWHPAPCCPPPYVYYGR